MMFGGCLKFLNVTKSMIQNLSVLQDSTESVDLEPKLSRDQKLLPLNWAALTHMFLSQVNKILKCSVYNKVMLYILGNYSQKLFTKG